MTTISGISARVQIASSLAATKAVEGPIRHAQALQEERDAVAKTVTAAPALDNTRENLDVTDTYEADDTFAHTEGQKLRGGRIDLII